MPVQRRERPQCRKILINLMIKRNCTLEQLLEPQDHFGISESLRIQARKMIEERDGKPNIPTRNRPKMLALCEWTQRD